MSPRPDYQVKFDHIASKTNYRLLGSTQQQFIKGLAFSHRFTLQELQLVSDMALDRLRWKEADLSEVLSENVMKPASSEQENKKKLLETLRVAQTAIRGKTKSYVKLNLDDKPKTVRPTLHATEKPNLGLGRCPVASEKTRCCNLLTLDAVEKCGFDCAYCSIQSFYHGDKVEFDANFKDKLKKLKLDPHQTYHIGTGQSSDSLMWGNHNGNMEALAQFAADNPNVILELKTKSKNINWLLQNDYPSNIICTWSLNPQIIIDHEEHLTASLNQRIEAAKKIRDKGRLVGFHFHPIVHYDQWSEDYRNIGERLQATFDSREVALVSLGTLTFTKSVMKTIRNRPLTSKILQMPMEEIAGKYSYPLDTKVDLFSQVYQSLQGWHDHVFFYLCMEAQQLWKPVFGFEYDSNLELEAAMKAAYFGKINALKI